MKKISKKRYRVIFTFDSHSLANLEMLRAKKGFTSLGGAVRDAIRLNFAIQNQIEQGFTEIIVRNPETGKERVLVS